MTAHGWPKVQSDGSLGYYVCKREESKPGGRKWLTQGCQTLRCFGILFSIVASILLFIIASGTLFLVSKIRSVGVFSLFPFTGFITMSLCRTSHLSRDNILLPHISAVPLMNADLMTAGAAEREAQIQRMSKAKSGTSLHCRYIFLSGTEQQWGHSYISLQISGVKSVSASSGPWLGRS